MKLKNHKLLIVVKEYSGVLAILISILIFTFGTIKDCSSSFDLKKNEYNTNAMNFRPFIIMEKPPIITDVFYEVDTSWIDYICGLRSIKDSLDLPGESTITGLRVNLKFTVQNNGNYPSRIVGVILADTNSIYPILDNWYDRKLEIELNRPEEFYQNIYLGVKGKHEFNYPEYKMKNSTDSSFIVHILVLYENDLNALYYSYFTVEYKLTVNEFLLNYEQIKKTQKFKYLRFNVRGDATRMVNFQFNSNFYKYEKANSIYEIIYTESNNLDKKYKDLRGRRMFE